LDKRARHSCDGARSPQRASTHEAAIVFASRAQAQRRIRTAHAGTCGMTRTFDNVIVSSPGGDASPKSDTFASCAKALRGLKRR